MELVRSIDTWLVSMYQVVVDWSQKQPAWWVEQCSFGLVLSALGLYLLGAYGSSIVNILAAGMFYVFSKLPFILAAAQKHTFRYMMVVIALIDLPAYLSMTAQHVMLNALSDLIWVSVYYFIACKPPRPKVPRGKVALT